MQGDEAIVIVALLQGHIAAQEVLLAARDATIRNLRVELERRAFELARLQKIVFGDRRERVDRDETISIGRDRSETVGADEKITIGANRTENVAVNTPIARLNGEGGAEELVGDDRLALAEGAIGADGAEDQGIVGVVEGHAGGEVAGRRIPGMVDPERPLTCGGRVIAIDGESLILRFGWLRGGLGVVNVATCMVYGGITGSATADTGAVGSQPGCMTSATRSRNPDKPG